MPSRIQTSVAEEKEARSMAMESKSETEQLLKESERALASLKVSNGEFICQSFHSDFFTRKSNTLTGRRHPTRSAN